MYICTFILNVLMVARNVHYVSLYICTVLHMYKICMSTYVRMYFISIFVHMYNRYVWVFMTMYILYIICNGREDVRNRYMYLWQEKAASWQTRGVF